MMHALRVWRVYHIDRPFTIETDHKRIEMVLTQKTTNRRVTQWLNELAEFQPLFKWIPGETNTVADALSLNPDFERKTAQISLQELLEAAKNREIGAMIRTNKVTVAQIAKTMYSWNRDLQWIIKRLKQGEDVPKYSLQDGILYYQTGEDETSRLYNPADEDLKNHVIYENHDAVSACHPCFFKTYLAVREKY
ncbi:unnamed protein product [Phytophthora fragariaefolia]|uniref:Unnamed protein product n=1 Tax=Phytophthora fragariaefolia TaxID=1490495 RepID=A0A9W6Y1L6_9STRA|nr:unnamed protein product [Phytophthora fragariaefolia]